MKPVLEGTTLQFFAHEEGRVVRDGSGTLMYQYNLTDHLGNVRLTYEDADSSGTIAVSTEVVQSNDPYPFGMNMAGLTYPVGSPKNSYLYNGKELQDEFGLNWYDFGARMYSPEIGRWNGVDALAEERNWLSPYNYVQNNPLIRIDPDGNLDDLYINGELADKAFQQLQASTSLTLSRDQGTGKVTAEKTTKGRLNKADRALLRATKDSKRIVNVDATDKNTVGPNGDEFFIGGAFDGNQIKDGKVIASQTVNPNHTEIEGEFLGQEPGTTVKHEIIEAYRGAVKYPGAKPNSPEYKKAHNWANKADPKRLLQRLDNGTFIKIDYQVTNTNTQTMTGDVNAYIIIGNLRKRVFVEKGHQF
jgi:RHS repeat-associated protein